MSFLDKETLKVVGTRPIRPDGVDKVTGRANFGADMVMPGMLWGKIKRSPHAHARILSINTDKAMALPGVKAVTTRADFPDIPPDKRVHRRGAGQSVGPVAQLHGRGQGALRGSCGRRGRRDLAGDRRAGARSDRGRIRGIAACHGCRGGDGAGCAAAARRHLHRGRRTQADQALERLEDGPLCQGRCRGRVRRGRSRHRAALYDKAGAPGLYRAACLRRLGSGGRTDHDLELEPGPVHGARLHLAHRRRRRSPTSARSRPRSAAALAARRSSISSRSPTCCRRNRAGRSRS